MGRLGCVGICLMGIVAAIVLAPVAALILRTNDDQIIAAAAYAQLALLTIAGGVFLAFRQSDVAEGLAYAAGAAAAVYLGAVLSFNGISNGQYNLPDNPYFSHYIGIPVALAGAVAGFLVVHRLRQRQRNRSGRGRL